MAISKVVYAGQTLIDLTDSTVSADTLAEGKIAYNAKGERITGNMSSSGGGGGSVASVPMKDVNFYDYDGTRLYSYTVAEAQALTELPALPTQPGLICQGWNWTLEDIKSYAGEYGVCDVGAMYITDDGKTRLYITIAAEGRMSVPLYISQTVTNGVTIDWGDGAATQTISGTGKVNATHTYTKPGNYVISLAAADGCTVGLGDGSSSYCVMGSTGNNGKVYCNMLKKVEIGTGVTSIGPYAFNYCWSLASIAIPNSVTSIGNYAFQRCYALTSVTISDSVTSIGLYAFSYCCSLASITIPNSVTKLNGTSFQYCSSLASVTIPNSVKSISANVFQYCSSLASVTIPNSVTSINAYAFRDCYTLASVTIPNGATSLGTYAFQYCYSLASIKIPNGISTIYPYTFAYCNCMAFYDFTDHTKVPTLNNTNAFSGIPSDCQIRVPAALYDEWIAASNWSTYASQIVAV